MALLPQLKAESCPQENRFSNVASLLNADDSLPRASSMPLFASLDTVADTAMQLSPTRPEPRSLSDGIGHLCESEVETPGPRALTDFIGHLCMPEATPERLRPETETHEGRGLCLLYEKKIWNGGGNSPQLRQWNTLYHATPRAPAAGGEWRAAAKADAADADIGELRMAQQHYSSGAA